MADVFAPLDLDDDCDSACTTNAAALSSDRVALEVADVFAPLDLDDNWLAFAAERIELEVAVALLLTLRAFNTFDVDPTMPL